MHVDKKMIKVQAETLDFKIEVFISKPEVTLASRSYISTMINGRYIKNYGLNQAIHQGYHTLLPIHRSPIVVLLISMDAILVDVNVHPTKLEVRFSKEKELFQTVEDMIKGAFREMTLIPEVEEAPKQRRQSDQYTLSFGDTIEDKEPVESKPRDVIYEQTSSLKHPLNERKQADDSFKTMETDATVQRDAHASDSALKRDISYTENQTRVPPMYPIGQLQGTYIFAHNEEGLFMIDQHAAQERIKYETFKEKLGKPSHEAQDLLLPITFEFSQQEALFINKFRNELEQVGLFFDPFGAQSYVVRSHPTWFPQG